MSREALSRLRKEYEAIQREAIPNAIAVPDPRNWLRWHYVIFGLDGCFSEGVYYGELKFPVNYPMGPPSIIMHTPNGRFIPDKKICTSMSDYHPESWSPIWKVSTIITGLISFMQDSESSTGCEVTTTSHKIKLAGLSMDWNSGSKEFMEIFNPYLERFVNKKKKIETAEPVQEVEKSRAGYGVLVFALLIMVVTYYSRQQVIIV